MTEAMRHEGVELRIDGPIRWIVFSEPDRRNPMGPAMMAGLEWACDQIERDAEARVTVVSAEGASFCAGGDQVYLRDVLRSSPAEIERFLATYYRPFLRLGRLPMPTIAAVNGHAIGGGLALALLCDIRVASDRALFDPAFTTLGFSPGLGLTTSLPATVGMSAAAEMLYTGDRIDADRALAIGLVSQVVPAERLAGVVQQLAERIASVSPLVNRHVKAQLFGRHRDALEARLRDDIRAQAVTAQTDDFRLGRRRSEFQGC